MIDLTPKPLHPRSKKKPIKFDSPVIAPKPFTGVDWSTSTQRPGCQDFLKCPSRRGDGLHEYRQPLLNASSIKQPMKDAK
jgi:hypothetical protein